jgi:hypothetical protein
MSAEVCAPVEALEIEAARALHAARWLRLLGGVAVWGCLDLSTPGRTFYTPATLTDGTPSPKPHWSATDSPERIVKEASEIDVVGRYEVARFRVAIRRAAYGLRWKLTDVSSRRLQAALATAGDGSTHIFEDGHAVVYAMAKRMPLDQWLRENGHVEEV